MENEDDPELTLSTMLKDKKGMELEKLVFWFVVVETVYIITMFPYSSIVYALVSFETEDLL